MSWIQCDELGRFFNISEFRGFEPIFKAANLPFIVFVDGPTRPKHSTETDAETRYRPIRFRIHSRSESTPLFWKPFEEAFGNQWRSEYPMYAGLHRPVDPQ